MTVSVGRIVHFQPEAPAPADARPLAAIVTGLTDEPLPGGEVFLAVFYFGEIRYVTPPYAETPTPGHWSWPPRA